ncbi:MAG: helix-turn-helix domain-containing protein [Oscillospiraceae bacterium]|nr:helix-turn-helix domain-containing protein [Oscillospiraceae bacterium]
MGENIRRFRRKLKLKQSDIAIKLNVNHRTVSSWETEFAKPPIDKLRVLAKLFNCTLDELVNDEQEDIKRYTQLALNEAVEVIRENVS